MLPTFKILCYHGISELSIMRTQFQKEGFGIVVIVYKSPVEGFTWLENLLPSSS